MIQRAHTPIWIAGALALVLVVSRSTIAHIVNIGEEYETFNIPQQFSMDRGFSNVVHTAAPAVVNIFASKIVRMPQLPPGAPVDEEFIRKYFHDHPDEFGPIREKKEHSRGSGVIVSRDGYVLTNHHMI